MKRRVFTRAPAGTLATTAQWKQGWWIEAQVCASPNFGPRPPGAEVDLVVIHSISLPPGVYGGNAIAQLFTNQLDRNAHPFFEGLRDLKVSAHFVIRRDGRALQFVSTEFRAWHAGVSVWRGRENCNDYSIGIELEGLEGLTFEAAQYRTLVRLLRSLATRHHLHAVVGHEHIAPARKRDPGPGFQWARLARTLGWPRRFFPALAARR